MDQNLQCSICLEDFMDPRILECFHTFCSSCLESIIQKYSKKSVFPCPICRKHITIPTNGIKDFQRNFYITERDETGKNETSGNEDLACKMCKKIRKLTCKCLKCGGCLCDICQQTHLQGERHDHRLIPIPQCNKKHECCLHPGKMLTSFCITCRRKICITCTSEEHLSHEHKNLNLVAEMERAKMAEVSNNMAKFKEKLDSALCPLKDRYKQMKHNFSEIKKNAEKRCTQLKEEIDISYQTFCQKTDDIQKKQKQTMINYAEILLERKETMDELISILESSKDLNDVDILDCARPVYDRFLRIAKEKHICLLSSYDFIETNDSYENPDVLGSLKKREISEYSVDTGDNILFTTSFYISLLYEFRLSCSEQTVQGMVALQGGLSCFYFDEDKVYIINKNGDLKQSISLPGKPRNIAVCPDGALLIIARKANTVWQVDKTYNKISTFSFTQQPIFICCTTFSVYILFSTVTSFLNLKRKSFVRKFDYSLNPVFTSQLSEEEQVLGKIRGFQEGHNGDLLLIESFVDVSTNYHFEEIVVLCSETLREKSRTKCCQSSGKSVKTFSVCADVYGNLLFADVDEKGIYRLEPSSFQLELLMHSTFGLNHQCFLTVDEFDHLWICDSKKKPTVKIFTYIK